MLMLKAVGFLRVHAKHCFKKQWHRPKAPFDQQYALVAGRRALFAAFTVELTREALPDPTQWLSSKGLGTQPGMQSAPHSLR